MINGLRKRRVAVKLWLFDCFCVKALRFLSDLAIQQTTRMITGKLLRSSPLPAEVVAMIGDHILRSHNIPRAKVMDLWAASQPSIQRCVCDGWGGPCSEMTCDRKTTVRWWPFEHAWVLLNRRENDFKAVICLRSSCQGHHDDDFKEADWLDDAGVEKLLNSCERSSLASWLTEK